MQDSTDPKRTHLQKAIELTEGAMLDEDLHGAIRGSAAAAFGGLVSLVCCLICRCAIKAIFISLYCTSLLPMWGTGHRSSVPFKQ